MKLKNIFLAIVVLASSGASLEAQTASEVAEQQKNLDLWRVEIAKSKDMPKENAMPLLGRCVVKMTDRGIYQIEERWEIYREAQAAILAIPGHAEYYRDRILKAKEERRVTFGTLEYGRGINDYLTERSHAKYVLQHLPSPETVRVLGDFLDDVEGGVYPVQDHMMEGALALVALEALGQLPLAKKPTSFGRSISVENLERNLPAWQNWYEQIKAGNRTFRFEGDPQEYDLDGPASKEKLQRVERAMKRDEERAAGHKKATSVTGRPASVISQISKPSTIAAILAACVLVAGAVWYFLKGRKVA